MQSYNAPDPKIVDNYFTSMISVAKWQKSIDFSNLKIKILHTALKPTIWPLL